VTDPAPPFLAPAPPVWAARGLASILLLLFAGTGLAGVLVRVPETVTAPFVLAPVRGADPVRAFRSGIVTRVGVAEAQPVAAGGVLFTIASTAVGDRAAEFDSLTAQIAGAEARLASRRRRDVSERLADAEDARRFEARVDSLTRATRLTGEQLALARERARRQQASFDRGLISWIELSQYQADAAALAIDAERAEADLAEARRALARLRHDVETRREEALEEERGLIEELERARIRRAALDQDVDHHGDRLQVVAPCAGTVLRLAVRSQGAVVQDGDVLAEMSCADDTLQAELALPQAGAGRVRPGHPVRLLYDAFPYQRYGTRSATISWISPVSARSGWRAFATLDPGAFIVDGAPRALVPGMAGRARVIIGRRSLASYALEPIRRLQENLGAGEPRGR
jgi:membrane fusion protein